MTLPNASLVRFLKVPLLALMIAALSAMSASTANLPAGFFEETVVQFLFFPTDMAFTPDGQRIYVAEKQGTVRMVENGALLPQTFVDLRTEVNDHWDRGLISIAIHPDFPQQPFVYLAYTYDPPETLTSGGHAAPDQGGHRVSRVVRLTADAANDWLTAVPGSQVVIAGSGGTWSAIGDPFSLQNNLNAGWTCYENGTPFGTPLPDCIPSDGQSHSIGGLAFGPDGALYVGTGDAASFGAVDERALRSLELDSMTGKLFRLDPLTGQGLPGNPFFDGDPSSNRSKVWSLGLRNPFRFFVHTTGEAFIGDVGWASWEEINHEQAGGGSDFGWPCFEGGSGTNVRQSGYENLPGCQAYYALEEATPALLAWFRLGSGGAAVAHTYYDGGRYPAPFEDGVFYGDYARRTLGFLPLDGTGAPIPDPPGTEPVHVDFATAMPSHVDLEQGPDGLAYYLSIATGELRRIGYSVGNGLDYRYFHGEWSVLPDFEALSPVKTGRVSNFGLEERLREDNYGFVFEGCVQVPFTGSWRFFTRSDDGSRLYLDGSLLVDSDGLHAPVEQSGTRSLVAGIHDLRVEFFEAQGSAALEVGWQGPGVSEQLIPSSALVPCEQGNRPPVLEDPGNQQSTLGLPLTLDITAFDPESQSLDFETTGLPPGLSFETANQRIVGSPSSLGTFSVTLSASDGELSSSVQFDWIITANQAPVANILSPSAAARFAIGETVAFSGEGLDPEQGALPGSALFWTLTVFHLDHTHPGFEQSGTSGSFEYFDHEDDTFFRLCLTATDEGGLSDMDCVDVRPAEVAYTFLTNPPGRMLSYSGTLRQTPFVVSPPAGSQRTLSAPLQQAGATFESWSVGGPRSQLLSVGSSDLEITATYDDAEDDPLHLRITSSGGYRHLKLGHNPNNPWGPKISPVNGHTHLELVLADFGGGADFAKLELVPQSNAAAGVTLGDYVASPLNGWVTVRIPLADFGPSAFEQIAYMSVPFSANAPPFEIGVARVAFVGGPNAPFVWFGAPHRPDNAFVGSGGGGELVGEIRQGGPVDPPDPPDPSAAVISTPSNGSTLSGGSAIFVWNDTGADSYRLLIGTTPGGSSLHDQLYGQNTQATVSGLPTNGIQLFVRLESAFPDETLFSDHSYQAFDDSTPPQPGEPSEYLSITNPGGYRHLKLGYGTEHVWSPKLRPAQGQSVLQLLLRDAQGDANWQRLEVAPSGNTEASVRLGDYIVGNPEGWFVVEIPLADFDASAFEDISHLSVPFSRDAGDFEIHLGRVAFLPSSGDSADGFVWFGSPEKTDNAFEGSGSGGQLMVEWVGAQ